jgi:hypothetical protein
MLVNAWIEDILRAAEQDGAQSLEHEAI